MGRLWLYHILGFQTFHNVIKKNNYICSRKTKDNGYYSINELKKTHDFVRAKITHLQYQRD